MSVLYRMVAEGSQTTVLSQLARNFAAYLMLERAKNSSSDRVHPADTAGKYPQRLVEEAVISRLHRHEVIPAKVTPCKFVSYTSEVRKFGRTYLLAGYPLVAEAEP